MQQFYVSKTLAEAMSSHIKPQAKSSNCAMSWFAHWVPVLGGGCTMVMEANTRYCMVFHNLAEEDYQRFEPLFRDRLTREVVALCRVSGANGKQLSELVKQSCSEFRFDLGLDYSISGDVYDAARHLQSIIEDLGGFPVVGVSEFSLGIKLNQEVLPQLGDAQAKTALDAFREHWLSQLGHLRYDRTMTVAKVRKRNVPGDDEQ